ncbi:MAG: hypothetical protein WBG34_16060 [Flavobacteriales bacterium]
MYLLLACRSQSRIVEYVSHGSYLVENATSTVLHIHAVGLWGPVVLLADSVLPGTTTEFFQVTEGSGGHLMPSNFLSELVITQGDRTSPAVVYNGIRNDDWHTPGTVNGRVVYLLKIQ